MLLQWPGELLVFSGQEPGVLTVVSHVPVEDVQEKGQERMLGFNFSEE